MWILDSLEKLKFVEQMCICSTTLPPQGLNITWSSGCIVVCRLNPSPLSWIISSQKEDERGQKTFGSKNKLQNRKILLDRKMLPNYSLPIGCVVGGPIMSVLRLAFSQTQIMMTMQNTRHNFLLKKV